MSKNQRSLLSFLEPRGQLLPTRPGLIWNSMQVCYSSTVGAVPGLCWTWENRFGDFSLVCMPSVALSLVLRTLSQWQPETDWMRQNDNQKQTEWGKMTARNRLNEAKWQPETDWMRQNDNQKQTEWGKMTARNRLNEVQVDHFQMFHWRVQHQ